jgi:hypothetical protein
MKQNFRKNIFGLVACVGLLIAAVGLASGCRTTTITYTTANPVVITNSAGTVITNPVVIVSTNISSGVVSVAGVTIDPKATGDAVRIAAKLGALAEIQHDPSTRQYFALSSSGLGAIIAAGTYDPTNIQTSLNNLTGNTIVSMSITDAISLYQEFFGKLVSAKLDEKSPYTVPVLTGLALGLQDAVNLTAPAANNTTSSNATQNTIPAPTSN